MPFSKLFSVPALKLSSNFLHPHQLRHSKGYQFASEGVDTRTIQGYMGHKNIQHTVLDTQFNSKRFKGFGKDV
jgi:site-specific recombinase XerD